MSQKRTSEISFPFIWLFKKNPNRRIAFDSRDINFLHILDVIFQNYPDATDELDNNFSNAFGYSLQTAIYCDSDHDHDKMTRRSITGLITYIGRTSVL